MLEVSHVNKSFDQSFILKDITFQLRSDDTMVILGPSGCGKTTLLHLISGMEKCSSGSILVNNSPVQKPTPDISFILQNFGLLPWKTILQNVALGLKIQGLSKKQRNKIAQELLAEMGLNGREHEFPMVLSGGEQQRVAIARAYASNPKLMLMDEPFSSLDAITREKLQDTLLASWKSSSVPYLLVTHSVEEAVYLGKRIVILAGNPAETQEIFDNPGFGDPGYRKSEAYYQLIRTIREQMETYW